MPVNDAHRLNTEAVNSKMGHESIFNQREIKLLAIAALLGLGACGGGSSPPPQNAEPVPYLNVSVDEFYFGTHNVGTNATQSIELANRSADIYPIKRLSLGGQHADEFALNFGGSITLNPSEKVVIDVSFVPLSEGLKNANLDVDYEIVPLGTPADSLNEQLYYDAAALEQERKYDISLARYKTYMRSDPVTANKQRAAIKLPVLNESQNYGDGTDFSRYIDALNSRDEENFTHASSKLNELLAKHPDSYLADDALYLKGYIELIDNENYVVAKSHFAQLQRDFPQSSYTDTAIYSEALALEKLGDLTAASEKYNALLARHRSQTWAALKLNIAKDNFNSRLWFDRANQGLDRIES